MTDHQIPSAFWHEAPEPEDCFQAKQAFCHGYDVYGELIQKISWSQYLFLLLTGEQLLGKELKLFDTAAVAVGNLGPKDPAIRGAMNAAVGGSQLASGLMAALSIGAGQYGGAHEVHHAVKLYSTLGLDLAAWLESPDMLRQQQARAGIDAWPTLEHLPGFDPNANLTPTTTQQFLDHAASLYPLSDPNKAAVPWLRKHHAEIAAKVGYPLAMTGVVSAVLFDLGLSPEAAELIYLLLRLPGCAAHLLDQNNRGVKQYPFFSQAVELMNDPKASSIDQRQSKAG